MNRQEKISSLIGDIGIPIIGFFFWNWSIYFICLFFLLDQLSREVSGIVRMQNVRERIKLTKRAYFLNSLSFLMCFISAHIYVLNLHPEINFLHEINAFFWYKDMGIAQGFILLPIVVFSERMRYKMNIKLFTDEMHVKHWYIQTTQLMAYFSLFLLLILALTFFKMSETMSFVCLLIGFTTITLFSDKWSTFFPR
jgi:hypothetical protein